MLWKFSWDLKLLKSLKMAWFFGWEFFPTLLFLLFSPWNSLSLPFRASTLLQQARTTYYRGVILKYRYQTVLSDKKVFFLENAIRYEVNSNKESVTRCGRQNFETLQRDFETLKSVINRLIDSSSFYLKYN